MTADIKLIEALLQALSSSSCMGVMLCRDSGQIVYINDYFLEAIGKDRAELSNIADVLPAKSKISLRSLAGGAVREECALGGAEYELIGAGVPTAEGSIEQAIVLLIQHDSSGYMLRSIGEVTARYGHDLNNLLGAIRGCSDMIQHKLNKAFPEGNPVERQLKLLSTSVNRSVELTTQMRSYARHDPLQGGKIQLTELLRAVLRLNQTAGACEVIEDIRADLDIKGNEFQLTQALLALVLNSIDAMKNNTERCLVVVVDEVSLEVDNSFELDSGRYASVSLIDHGKGMSKAQVEQAMQPFFSTKGPSIGSGLGLGLPMVRELLVDHGGSVKLSSVPGCGTVVQLVLPVYGE